MPVSTLRYAGVRVVVLILMLWGAPSAVFAQSLDLAEAERVALARDALLRSNQKQAQALRQRAIADGQLPDPQLKLGLANFPIDTFDRAQEPMTQVQIGVQQMFPAGDSLGFKRRRSLAMAQGMDARSLDQALTVRRDVRLAWLDTLYWAQARVILDQNRHLFEQLLDITELHYATGQRKQQDVTRAQLELGLLDDRLLQYASEEEQARAGLAKWVGADVAAQPLSGDFSALSSVTSDQVGVQRLSEHPLMAMESSQVQANQMQVGVARESFKPGWGLDLTYGLRDGQNPNGEDRADFVSATVKVDLPVFTGKRQGPRLAASQEALAAAMDQREERLRELTRMYEQSYAAWSRLNQRVGKYNASLLPKARENARAALNAYQSDIGDFTSLMRARITELDTQLQSLRVRVDRAKARARLRYFEGEES